MWLQGSFQLAQPWLPQLFRQPDMWTLDSMMHSIPIWLCLAGIGLFFRIEWLKWLVIGGFFHIMIDIFTHKQFIDAYIWPVSKRTIPGIVDYHTPVFMAFDGVAIFLALVYGVSRWGLKKLYMFRKSAS
ncbi:hypothetical protein LSG31_14860 [Fodinisporobacter ferrooxydans]|uniref:Metal-dependent hydrolase n=1 Tax=Fodinisporobacter ferrooxydans TaxID=2901836 RepID=A0ABY4CF97_9BACL|nr:hypothetical protein LSG31_14860 [Alicyclobacillaceae bacterium MYW30-H2]